MAGRFDASRAANGWGRRRKAMAVGKVSIRWHADGREGWPGRRLMAAGLTEPGLTANGEQPSANGEQVRRTSLGLERASAAAALYRVRVFERETSLFQSVEEIDRGAIEVQGALFVHHDGHAVLFVA